MRHIFVSSQEEVEYETEGTTRELRGNVLSCLISSLLHFLANSALLWLDRTFVTQGYLFNAKPHFSVSNRNYILFFTNNSYTKFIWFVCVSDWGTKPPNLQPFE